MSTQTQQVIIRGDEAFVQTIQERPAGSIEKILESMLQGDNKEIIFPMSFPSMAAYNEVNYLAYNSKFPEQKTMFARINYWPMQHSTMYRVKTNGEVQDYYRYTGNRDVRDVLIRNGYEEDEIDIRPLSEGNWKIPQNYTCWLMLPIDGRTLNVPYVFMMDCNFNPYIPHFPNVYKDTGRICAGEDYDQYDYGAHPLEILKHGVLCLHDAPPNNDLRTAREGAALRWDMDGKSINPSDDAMNEFLDRDISDHRIINFAKWLKER